MNVMSCICATGWMGPVKKEEDKNWGWPWWHWLKDVPIQKAGSANLVPRFVFCVSWGFILKKYQKKIIRRIRKSGRWSSDMGCSAQTWTFASRDTLLMNINKFNMSSRKPKISRDKRKVSQQIQCLINENRGFNEQLIGIWYWAFDGTF